MQTLTPLCFKCGRHGYCAVVCIIKGLHFHVEEPKSKLESYPKEEGTYNESELSEECDSYDGTIEKHDLVVRPLLAANKEKY